MAWPGNGQREATEPFTFDAAEELTDHITSMREDVCGVASSGVGEALECPHVAEAVEVADAPAKPPKQPDQLARLLSCITSLQSCFEAGPGKPTQVA